MKKLVPLLVVVFVLFWMVQQPDTLAQFAKDGGTWVWDMVQTVFGATIDFLSALFK